MTVRLRNIGICFILASLLLLPGCGNSRDIQNLAYVTALGMDYVNGKYMSYVQVLNFTNIAKSENVELGKKIPIWIGAADGETVSGSLADITTTSQIPLFWGHLKVIVVTENMIKHGLRDIYSTLNRGRDVRYNILVYGTKEDIPKLLTQTSLFNLSPLDTILFTGAQLGSQKTYLLPLKGHRGISNMNETGNPGYLPSISLSPENWSEDKKSKDMFQISGAYFFTKTKYKNWMSLGDLKGIRWMNRHLEQTPLQVPAEGQYKAVLTVVNPRSKIKPIVKGSDVQFDIHLDVKSTLTELVEDVPFGQLEKEAAQAIEKEIRETYKKALSKECDPFQLGEALYRQNPSLYNKLSANGETFFLQPDSLRHVIATVHITTVGKYKGHVQRQVK
ncbi:Ger(x)C family spore germination protein [Paenibacillus protaetiae]|uniref:Ger(X)C family spore germination protein n=1 Tax=Paenibacillus protaetiae TaxID=2509456 RepID=A0A4V0YEY7_9BACL|nr:Ger(x)C family spore germination protein [Paenibacillus protaetiae]QAY65851.1 Ger(x)C family spore germination protein [Paenibacillus protaetiae]